MPYYRAAGDFYRGDYYRGDFWSSAVGMVKNLAGPALSAIGTALGGPVGGLLGGTIGGAIAGNSQAPAQAGAVQAAAMPSLPTIGGAIARVAKSPAVRSVATGIGTAVAVDALGRLIDAAGNPVRKRHRSINVTNVHALRRALRRVDGFKHLAKKVGACPPHRRTAPAARGCCK